MKLAIDLTNFDFSYVGGVATFTLGLTRGLIQSAGPGDEIVLLATARNRDELKRRFNQSNVSTIELDSSSIHRYPMAMLRYIGFVLRSFKLPYWYDRLFRAGFAAKVSLEVDVVIAPMTHLPFYGGAVPKILCVHDIQHEYHPENFSFRERASRWTSYRLSCWSATAIQASSQFIKDSLLERFDFLTANKIFIAPEGVDFDAFDPDAVSEVKLIEDEIEPGGFLFYPAQLWPHKNHLLLIEALTKFKGAWGFEMPCILTGQDCGMLEQIRAAIARAGLSKVRYLGKVPFAQLLWLYANCRAVLALGLHESSSLPLREGAVFGKPLICSDIPPNRELVRDLSIVMFVANSASELATKLGALESDCVAIEARSSQNKQLVQRFNWDRIAEQYFVVARDLVQAHGSKTPAIGHRPVI